MHIPGEAIDQFFNPMVGDSSKVNKLDRDLRLAVNDEAASKYMDSYSRLSLGGLQALEDAYGQMPHATKQEQKQRSSLYVNGRMGVEVTVGTMKALSHIYMDTVQMPQDIAGVRKNASTALRHTYGVAFSDRGSGTVNFLANSLGLSPRNPVVWASLPLIPYLAMPDKKILIPTGVSPHAFRPELDDGGQLHISPRHRRMGRWVNRQCPAVNAKVSTSEGSRSALLVFMKTIGNVAIEEIYPKQFDIA